MILGFIMIYRFYSVNSKILKILIQSGRVGKRLFVCPPKPIKLKQWAKQKDVLPTLPDYLTETVGKTKRRFTHPT
jgi:hypothetical protein